MKSLAVLLSCLGIFVMSSAHAEPMGTVSPEQAEEKVIQKAKSLQVDEIERLATQQNGRVKPFHTLAHETLLYVTGSNKKWGVEPVQLYLAIIAEPASVFAELIEVRDPELRVKLGYLKTKRYFSLAEIESSSLGELSQPIFKKQEANARNLTEAEKKILEAAQQFFVLRSIQSAETFFSAIDFTSLKNEGHQAGSNPQIQEQAKAYLSAISAGDLPESQRIAKELVISTRTQETPDLFKHYLEKLDLEIFYTKARFFFWASILGLILGFVLLVTPLQKKIPFSFVVGFHALPVLFQAIAIGIRVYITRFAPVTNMYGTMIWVSLGVIIFSFVLLVLYKNRFVSGLMLLGSGLILLLTENTPLVLSPDMDPIVAVLRSNYWLSTHVTTITISYAAFTVAMILGNFALIRVWTHKDNTAFFKEYAHYAYRMIQLGVFLLTMGIILGGIWADYSWGRFWGWDPKETWALIADLGFLAILHARYTGWLTNFTLLAWSPMAYLLVVMAWYGVNFILAAGLHSYGFSSGGATAIAIFVSLQLALIGASWLRVKAQSNPAT